MTRLSIVIVASICGSAIAQNKPNIVLIMVDTLRADHLGCYGYERDTSPNIDKLVEEGTILYEQAYSPASWTFPSIMSIFSGMMPAAHGCTHGSEILPKQYGTIAQTLEGKGYFCFGRISDPSFRSAPNRHKQWRTA